MNNNNQESLILESLAWRYATKRFDPTKAIPDATWKTLEESLRLAPSSFGLQPWRFVVVTNPTIRKQLQAHSWNQPQIVEASHLVVLTSARDITEDSIDSFIQFTAETRALSPDQLKPYRDMIAQFVNHLRGSHALESWTTRQTYIALGTLLTSAALLRVDACPLEGINPAEYDSILGLDSGNFSTRVACALGYRSQEDASASLSKVRYPHEQVFSYHS